MNKYAFRLNFDYEKTEQWLNAMAGQGWMFQWFLFGLCKFVKGTPGEYIYRMELLPYPAGNAENANYLRFAEETGVEVMCTWVRWVIYRRRAADGAFAIYTDIDSRIAHYRRIRKFLLFFCVLEWSVAALTAVQVVHTLLLSGSAEAPSLAAYFTPLFAALLGFIIFRASGRMAKKQMRLEKEKQLTE